jgi:hypothetical protein
MTRDEIIEAQTAIQWRCQGEPLLTRAYQSAATTRYEALITAGDGEGVCRFIESLDAVPILACAPIEYRGARAAQGCARAGGCSDAVGPDLETCTGALAALITKTRGCGEDLKPTIQGVPFDGQVHRAVCPREGCHVEHEWRAALCDEERDAGVAAADAQLRAALGAE